jgi:hypothetical protein
MSNRRPALIRESDARRLAKVAKSEGVSVEVEVGGIKIIIRPDDPAKPIEEAIEIIL